MIRNMNYPVADSGEGSPFAALWLADFMQLGYPVDSPVLSNHQASAGHCLSQIMDSEVRNHMMLNNANSYPISRSYQAQYTFMIIHGSRPIPDARV